MKSHVPTSLKFLICSFNILHGNFSISTSQYMCLAFFQRRQWHPTPILLPGKCHGQRRLVGCIPWGREELDMTERLPFHFSLSCMGEGNGNPLQCSCLENPRDGRAWWAAIYGVAQSWTRLKRLSSSSSSSNQFTSFLSSYFPLQFSFTLLPFQVPLKKN